MSLTMAALRMPVTAKKGRWRPNSRTGHLSPACDLRGWRASLRLLLGIGLEAVVLGAASLAVAAPVDGPSSAPRSGRTADHTVILVRHAEVVPDGGRDPVLSPAGEARARALSDTLAGEHPTLIIVSDTRRSRQTAAVLAAHSGARVRVVDIAGGDLQAHVSAVISAIPDYAVGPIVIVGHSNTLPLIASALGAPAQPDLAHDCFDSLWRLTPRQDAGIRFQSGHYGAPSPACRTTGAPFARPAERR